MDTIFKGLVLVALAAGVYQIRSLRREVKKMADTQDEILAEEQAIEAAETEQTALLQTAVDQNAAELKEIADLKAQLAAGADLSAVKAGLDRIQALSEAHKATLTTLTTPTA